MSPIEARLFTLEARLRSEENNRIKIYEEIKEVCENLKKHSYKKDLASKPQTPRMHRKSSLEPSKGIEGKSLKIQRMSLGAFQSQVRRSGSSCSENIFNPSPDLSILEIKFQPEAPVKGHKRVSSYNSSKFQSLPILSPKESTPSKAVVHSKYIKPSTASRMSTGSCRLSEEDP
jgi:hypothetical protein